MKRLLLILPSLLMAASLSAQSIYQNIPEVEHALSSRVKKIESDLIKQNLTITKSFGDTIYYQDFNGGIPTGWSIVNNNPNNFSWTWDTVYQNGQFSAPTNVITSTTASNGFMVLPADFYNTPIPTTGAVAMDTYFETDSIDLTKGGTAPNGYGSVWVTYQHAMRYCCSGANRLVMQVSTDNFNTFREYDATNAMPIAAASGTIVNVIKISDVATYATSIKIRFLSKDNSHYYWMIDDFAIIEGAENDLVLQNPTLEFNSTYQFNPFYHQIPFDLFSPLSASGSLYNEGSNDLTGVQMKLDISNTYDCNGGPGLGLVYNNTTTPFSLPSYLTIDSAIFSTTSQPGFSPTTLGTFQADLVAESDSLDQDPSNNSYNQWFLISDTIYAKDDNGYGGGTGPGSFVRNGQVGGTTVGDKFGTMYIVESRAGNGPNNLPTSITFAVSDDPNNIGVQIVPTIWKYEEDSLSAPASGTIAAAFSGGVIASSFIPYTIQASDIDTLLTLPLDNAVPLDSGQYVVGWEVTNTNGGRSFEVYEDASSGAFQKKVTCFVDLAHLPGWGWVDANPVIRLNMSLLYRQTSNCAFVNIEKNTKDAVQFSIRPNPNNGLFTVNISTKQAGTYNLNVRNMLGQRVLTDVITVNGNATELMDLTQFDKGVYFVSLENNDERVIKKIIVQ